VIEVHRIKNDTFSLDYTLPASLYLTDPPGYKNCRKNFNTLQVDVLSGLTLSIQDLLGVVVVIEMAVEVFLGVFTPYRSG
jgi:hypothetical protein